MALRWGGAELTEDDENRYFKGRVVFLGSQVKDQDDQAALLMDLGNALATMDASRAADCYGCFPGHTVEIADAEQAYVQAELKGTPCWVSLPPDQVPERYRHMREPVF